jgi:hypothetical protein
MLLLASGGRGLMILKLLVWNLALNTPPVGTVLQMPRRQMSYGRMGCGAMDILGTNFLVASVV